MNSFPDIFGIVGKFGEEREEPRYLTSFEVLNVEEVEDEKLKQVGSPFVRIFFRPRMYLPKLPLRIESLFTASTWASPGYVFNDLFPISGSEYTGFPDQDAGQTGWKPQMDGTLYASRDDARDACGSTYRGIAIAELWPVHLLSENAQWLIFHEHTRAQKGPYANADEAEQAAENAGPEWKVSQRY